MSRVICLCLIFTGIMLAAGAATKGPEPLVVAHGERVELTDYLVPGKIVIFDFTSKYCPPCQRYEKPLRALHQQRPDLVVVKRWISIVRAWKKSIGNHRWRSSTR